MLKSVKPDPSLDTVPKLFHAQVKRFRDRVAMRDKVLGVWKEISWSQYGENVRVAGTGLVALGIKKVSASPFSAKTIRSGSTAT